MITGEVKFFNKAKGFGFITEEWTTTDYFVHATRLIGVTELAEKQRVSFEVEQGERGKMAVNVKVLED